MKWGIGLVGHRQPLTPEAVGQTVEFVKAAKADRVSFLDWHFDPVAPLPKNAKGREQMGWLSELATLTIHNHVYALNHRVEWNNRHFSDDRASLKQAISKNNLEGLTIGKQTLLDDALASGLNRLLLIHVGSWLADDAPALFEEALQGHALAYPSAFVRADDDGDIIYPYHMLPNPEIATLENLAVGIMPSSDCLWVNLDVLRATPTQPQCTLLHGDGIATLSRILAAGDGVRANSFVCFRCDLPLAEKQNRRTQQPDNSALVALKGLAKEKHGGNLKSLVRQRKALRLRQQQQA